MNNGDITLTASRYSRLFWNEWQLGINTTSYNISYSCNVMGKMNTEKMLLAFKVFIVSNPYLCSYFAEDINGDLKQFFTKLPYDGIINIDMSDCRQEEIDGYICELLNFHFDLTKPPLFKFAIIKISPTVHRLLFFGHHIIADGHSLFMLTKQISSLYNNEIIENLENSYKTGIEKQKAYIQSETKVDYINLKEKSITYWENLIQDASLYVSLPKPLLQTQSTSLLKTFKIDGELKNKFDTYRKKNKTTPFQIISAIWGILISRYNGNSKVVITYTANMRRGLFSDVFGGLVNVIPYVLEIEKEDTFLVLSSRLLNQRHNTKEYNTVCFGDVIKELKCRKFIADSSSKIFNIGITETIPRNAIAMQLDGLETESLTSKNLGGSELNLEFFETDNSIEFQINVQDHLFDNIFIENIAKHFIILATECINSPEMILSKIDILSQEEKELIRTWNNTIAQYPQNETIYSIFEKIVLSYPDKIAVVFEDKKLTFLQLNQNANKLANFIRSQYLKITKKEITGDTLIGIYIDRSLEMAIGILGILKSGCAYVPFDIADPIDRQKFKFKDSKCQIIISSTKFKNNLLEFAESATIIMLDDQNVLLMDEKNLIPINKPTDLAYIIYTSGSTGDPKGVMIEHKSAINTIFYLNSVYENSPTNKSTWFTSYVFDVSVSELFNPLLNGTELHIFSEEKKENIEELSDYIIENRITNVYLPPVMLALLPKVEYPDLKILIYAGEPCDQETGEYWSKEKKLYNMYGPTETTIYSVGKQVIRGDVNVIGRPINNTTCYILDSNMSQIPIGVIGELHIGGDGLSRGYLNRKELTSKKFIINPFIKGNETDTNRLKLYKTGDLCRYLNDGNIEFIGRNDYQIKLKGFRIELREIESVIDSIPEINQSIVTCQENKNGKYLAAYYTLNKNIENIDLKKVREYICSALPHYMCPSVFIKLDNFPLNTSGKINRKKLPLPEFKSDDSIYVPPRNDQEKLLCEIWEKILGLSRVGIEDDFFAIGGDSISSIRVINLVKSNGIIMSVKDIFDFRTIRRLLERNILPVNSHIEKEEGVLSGEFDLIPIQKWFLEQDFPKKNHFNQAFIITPSSDDIEILKNAIKRVLISHDSLRSTFRNDKQIYNDDLSKIQEISLLDIKGKTEEEIDTILTELQSNFDIENGPIYAIRILTGYDDKKPRIFFAVHHLAIDVQSWRAITYNLSRIIDTKTDLTKSSSFRQWSYEISQYASRNKEEVIFWEKILTNHINYVPLYKLQDPYSMSIEISEEVSTKLVYKCNDVYHTRINDLLLTALGYALMEWNGISENYIALEGHGREEISDTVDISLTVGWFTNMYPVKLHVLNNIENSIINIKEMLNSIPNKGIGYGAIKYSNISTLLKRHILPNVSFNYLGELKPSYSNWSISTEHVGETIPYENIGSNILSINGLKKEANVNFMFTSRLSIEDTEKIINSFKKNLEKITEHCTSVDYSKFTPSDFPSTKISLELLNKIQQKREISALYNAGSLQKGMLFHYISYPNDDAYIVQSIFEYSLPISVSVYKEAWIAALNKFPTLRTFFNWEESLIQIISKNTCLNWDYIDLSKSLEEKNSVIEKIRREDRLNLFDLRKPELIRIKLIKFNDSSYFLLKTIHHSVIDGWSWPVLITYVHAAYNDLKTTGKIFDTLEDISYSEAQMYYLKNMKQAIHFWEKAVELYEEADNNALHTKIRNIDVNDIRVIEEGNEKLIISGNEYERIKILAKKSSITMNSILQFAWHKLLSVYTGDKQSICGTIVSNRGTPVHGIESSVGLYSNTLPISIDWDHDRTVQEQLEYIHTKISEIANTWTFVDLSKLHRYGRRLFHSLFIFENYPQLTTENNLNVKVKSITEKFDYPLTLMASDTGSELGFLLKYSMEHVNEIFAKKILSCLNLIISQLDEKLTISHKEITLSTNEEVKKIIEEERRNYHSYKYVPIHTVFERQVELNPTHKAISYQNTSFSYKELNDMSNKVASIIRQQYREKFNTEMPTGTIIAFYTIRSIRYLASVIGVLKAGGAFLALDTHDPEERTDYIIDDCQCKTIITNSTFIDKFQDTSFLVLTIESMFDDHIIESKNLNLEIAPNSVAYMRYVASASGKPKGVMTSHYAIANKLYAIKKVLEIDNSNTILIKTMRAFDISLIETLGTFVYGATGIICEYKKRTDPYFLSDTLSRNKIDMVFLTPKLLENILHLDHKYTVKKTISFGEKLPEETIKLFFAKTDNCTLYNSYGVTEATIITSIKKETNTPPFNDSVIGELLPDQTAYILSEDGKIIPPGAIGELYIGGETLALGYYGKEKDTRKHFIPNKFASKEEYLQGRNLTLYKTGDLAKINIDNDIEFIRKKNKQVKIKGIRVDLIGVENLIKTYVSIKDAAVFPLKQDDQNILVACYSSDNENLSKEELEIYLSSLIPAYMIPSIFVKINEIPRNPKGRVDFWRLPEIENLYEIKKIKKPRSKCEIELCCIIEDLLNIKEIGIENNIFELGCNSMLAIKLSILINAKLGLNVTVNNIFEYPTVSSLLKHLSIINR